MDNNSVIKIIVFIRLIIVLVIFFISVDIILFYFFFEISMIPTFFLIVYWGLNYERLRAAYYLIIYILIISFPILVFLLSIFKNRLTFKFTLLNEIIIIYRFNLGGYIIIYGAFFIKIPLYMFHI